MSAAYQRIASSGEHNGAKVLWQPNSAPQQRFLETEAYEALYGGAAGGGKSDALLACGLRYVQWPRSTSIIFRRSFPELQKTLIERSRDLFPRLFPHTAQQVGARYNQQDKLWRFPAPGQTAGYPGGARFYFGQLEYEDTVLDHQSAEYQSIGFDEQTHFTKYQYLYMLSRLRGPPGIPIRVRGATNPGGEGHNWNLEKYGPWLDKSENYRGPRARSGEVLHYVVCDDGREEWVDPRPSRSEGNRTLFFTWDGREVWIPFDPDKGEIVAEALSRVFVGAKVTDNPDVDAKYATRLRSLPPLERAQLKDGDWMARPTAGAFFQRPWFKIIPAAPSDDEIIKWVRRWDQAATEPTAENPDPDWTRGVRMGKTKSGLFVVSNAVGARVGWRGVESLIQQTAEIDGSDTEILFAQDPGSAGKDLSGRYVTMLSKYVARALPETGDKQKRAGPMSAQTEAGNVALVRGPWNEEYISEMESFPEGPHDDYVDASSGAFNALQPTLDEEQLEARLKAFTGQGAR